MRRLLLPLAITGLLTTPLVVHGQGSEVYGPGLRLNPHPEKDAFIRFIFWNQLWGRSVQNNPGTMVNGVAADNTMDVGIRRSRFLAFAQINPRYRVLFHAGINNQTFSTGGVPNGGVTGNGGTYASGKKPGIFIHDAWNEYDIVPAGKREDGTDKPFSLTAGVGLHYFNGVSRMSSASTLNFLAIDAPIFNWYNIEMGDQFARQLGYFLKGKVGRLDYRLHVNKPFATSTAPTPALEPIAVDNNGTSKAAYGGYFMYQFLEKESNVLPFTVGSYLGTKKVFNIGAGFYNQADGTVSSKLMNNGADTVVNKHAINLFGVDVFADIPFGGEKNMAVTAYSVYYMHDWGPNYYRNVGIMNVGTADPAFTGQRSFSGAGNARPLLGTGSIWYTQAGLLLPKGISSKFRLQPFAAYTMHDLDRLGIAVPSYDAGMNLLLDGHHAKITLQYSARPDIHSELNEGRVSYRNKGTLGEVLLQAQVYL